MSRVVRGVGSAISGVIKGVTKAVKTVASSKLGKIALIAAAVYFGVPALSGLMGGGAAAASGLSGFAGATANLSAAWSGLTGAASSALAGNFASAGSQLSAGMLGGSPALADAGVSSLSAGAAAPTAELSALAPEAGGASFGTGLTGQALPSAGFGSVGGMPAALQPGVASFAAPGVTIPAATEPGMLAGFMKSPYAAPALISAGGQMISGVGQGIAAKSAQDHQDQLAADARLRANTNVGTQLWGSAPAGR
jgi:hypothetical protein